MASTVQQQSVKSQVTTITRRSIDTKTSVKSDVVANEQKEKIANTLDEGIQSLEALISKKSIFNSNKKKVEIKNLLTTLKQQINNKASDKEINETINQINSKKADYAKKGGKSAQAILNKLEINELQETTKKEDSLDVTTSGPKLDDIPKKDNPKVVDTPTVVGTEKAVATEVETPQDLAKIESEVNVKQEEIQNALSHFGNTEDSLKELDTKFNDIKKSVEMTPKEKLKKLKALETELKTVLKGQTKDKASKHLETFKKNVQTTEAKHHLKFQAKCADAIANVKKIVNNERKTLKETVKSSLQEGFFVTSGATVSDENCSMIADLLLQKEYGSEYSFQSGGDYEPKSDAELDEQIKNVLRSELGRVPDSESKVNKAFTKISQQLRSTEPKRALLRAPIDAMVIMVNTNNSYRSHIQASLVITETYQSIAETEDLSLKGMIQLDQQMTQTSNIHEVMLLGDRSKTTITKDRLEDLIKNNCNKETSESQIKEYTDSLMDELESNGIITKDESGHGQIFTIDTNALDKLTEKSGWTKARSDARKGVETFGKRRGLYEKYVKGDKKDPKKDLLDKKYETIENAFKDDSNKEKLKKNPSRDTILNIIKGAVPNSGIPGDVNYDEFINDVTDLVSILFSSENIVQEAKESGKVQTTEIDQIGMSEIIDDQTKFLEDLHQLLESTHKQNQSGQAAIGIENMGEAYVSTKMGSLSSTQVLQYKCSDICKRINNSKTTFGKMSQVVKESRNLAKGAKVVKDAVNTTDQERVEAKAEGASDYIEADSENKTVVLLDQIAATEILTEAGINTEDLEELLKLASDSTVELTESQAKLMAKTELGEHASESEIATKAEELIQLSIDNNEDIHGQIMEVTTNLMNNLSASIMGEYTEDVAKEVIGLVLQNTPVLGALVTTTKMLGAAYTAYSSGKIQTKYEKALKFSTSIDDCFNPSDNMKNLFAKMKTAEVAKERSGFNAACECINLLTSPFGISAGSGIKALKKMTTFADLKEADYKNISAALMEHHSQEGLHKVLGRTSEEATSELVSALQTSATDPNALQNVMKAEGNYGDLKGANLEMAKEDLKESLLKEFNR